MNGKQYIGITSMSLEDRCGIDGSRYRNCNAFWNAIQKYGWNNFSHKILAYDLTREKANELEIYYISKFNTMAPNGYNLTPGGEVYERTEEMRKHMSKVMMGNKSRTGMKNSEKHKKRMSEFMTGNTYGAINAIKYGKPVEQYTLDGEYIRTFGSLCEAERVTGVGRSHIRMVLNGQMHQSGGFIWKRRGQ